MNTQTWLSENTTRLLAAGIETARLDCLVLLADQLDQDKSWLLSHPEHVLQGSEIEILGTKIAQREQHVPLAYIRGKAEFYGREFVVNPHTLVPRPETETMIDLLKGLGLLFGSKILDVGTGSGCIAITAALELPGMSLSGCDIDPECVRTARHNAEKLGAHVAFFASDLLAQAPPQNALAANLPYVPDNFQINTAATHEPRTALFGGADGLDVYRELFKQIAAAPWKPQHVLAESLPPQHEALVAIAGAHGFRLQQTNDFIQVFNYSR